jgi:E3 SUMO-protein ligase NSE2
MREFLDVTAEMTAHSQILDDLHQQVARGEKIVSAVFPVNSVSDSYKQNNVVVRYKAGLQERLEEYAGKTTRQKYAKNPKYLEFRSSIWVCQTQLLFFTNLCKPLNLGSGTP